MAVSYAQVLSVDMIVTEVEALVDWRNQALRHCFFPGVKGQESTPQAPSVILDWCRAGKANGAIESGVLERMELVHQELSKSAQALLDRCASGALPTTELYDAFYNQFEAYILQVRRLHQDVSDAGMAVDTLTGLRTASGMRNDLHREQDRYDRKGTSFSIASIAIDNLSDWQQQVDRKGLEAIYVSVASVIKRTIRSFDDAYFMGKGEYILVLKHVDFMDACTVMDRLRMEIEQTPVAFADGAQKTVTVSCGIAEAMQRDKPETALENAKAAVQHAKGEGGNRVHEYHERSVLEQYAHDVQSF